MAQPFPNELEHLYDEAEFIGSGGFAQVFKARRKDSRIVAVKIPLKLDEVTGKSFLREITSWQRLNHQNIVSLFDANILPIPYLEQEYMDGGSLERIKKPLEIVKACKIVFEIAEGLKYAHKQGIVHRDLKPQNVLLTKDNVPKITDWGMSRVVDAFKSSTQQGFTPVYAAPEQVSPKKFGKPDERTDIYQLGVILYNLITNDLPFKGDDLVEIASAIVMEEPIPPSKSNPEAWEVELIVLRCLSKKKEDRYQSVEELQEKLFELIEKERERKEREIKAKEEQERRRKQREEEERAKKEREEQERLQRKEEERKEGEIKAKEEQERLRKQMDEEERAKRDREEQESLQRKDEEKKERERKAREEKESEEREEAEIREKERLRRQIGEAKTRKRDELSAWKEKTYQKKFLAAAVVLGVLLTGWAVAFFLTKSISSDALAVFFATTTGVIILIILTKEKNRTKLSTYVISGLSAYALLDLIGRVFEQNLQVSIGVISIGGKDMFIILGGFGAMVFGILSRDKRMIFSLAIRGFLSFIMGFYSFWFIIGDDPNNAGVIILPAFIIWGSIYGIGIGSIFYNVKKTSKMAGVSAVGFLLAMVSTGALITPGPPFGYGIFGGVFGAVIGVGMYYIPLKKNEVKREKLFDVVAAGLMILLLGYWMFPFGSNIAPETINSTPSPTPNLASTEVQSNVTPTFSPTQIATTPPTTFTNSIGMEFMLIPAGEFDMGSPESEKDRDPDEGPVHRVNISKPFYMGKYKVTQKQWSDVMGNNPSNFKGDDLPVQQVSWYDVQDFIKKLNEKEGTNKYRLTSEAEWEYAIRAGTNTTYFFGDNISELGDYAWDDGAQPHPVGKKKPNPWGLYDMRGNANEWVQDIYHDNYNGAPSNSSAWEGAGSKRVLRGSDGCSLYNNMDFKCRSASRYSEAQGISISGMGFRLVMEITTNVSLPTNITPSVPSIPIITPSSNQEIFTNSIGIEFVQIPSGEFDMGSPVVVHYSERPIHHVIISKPFYMGKYEVTQKQWMDIMGNNPSYFKGDDLPIEQVSWYDVQEYIKKLNEKEGTDRYRLPSEAEWEYAARAGTNTTYSFGNNKSELGDYAWYDRNSGGKTHEVGQKMPNPWGLYDMHGNVLEWVQDTFANNTYDGAPTNGSAWESRDNSTIQDYYYMKVVRGDNWDRDPRSAARDWQVPQKRLKELGFRLVRDL